MSVESSALNVERSAPRGAVFLSYASQDAEAAKRIADALRGAGVEVWFDAEGGLEHGDEWDAKIRRQIKECVLFIAVISANTQAREEGYFRIEWELAAQRALGIASGVAFILPVVIDGTKEAGALVPDRFRSVQWTKLPGGNVPPDVLQRFLKLWSHRTGALKNANVGASLDDARGRAQGAPLQGRNSSALRYGLAACALFIFAVAAYLIFKPRRSPEEIAKIVADAQKLATAATPPAPAAAPRHDWPRDADLKRALSLLYARDAIAGDFALAEDIVKPQLAAHPNEPEVATVAAMVAQEFLTRGFDTSEERRATVQRLTERAVQLAPDNPVALAALGRYLAFISSQLPRAEKLLRRAIELSPDEPRYYRTLLEILHGPSSAAEAESLIGQMSARFPQDALVRYDIARYYKDTNQVAAMERTIDETLALEPLASAMVWKCWLALEAHGDVPGMKANLDRVPERQRMQTRVASALATYAEVSGQAGEAVKLLNDLPDTWLSDFDFTGPKALLLGNVLTIDGRRDLARLQYEAALAEIKRTEERSPTDLRLRRAEFWALLGLGRRSEALATLQILLQATTRPYRVTMNNSWWHGSVRAALLLDQRTPALELLREAADNPTSRMILRHQFQLDPRMAPFRDDPEIKALLAEPERKAEAPAPPQADDKSVAVLAFANLSDDKTNEYFSDGISEELLNVLCKVPKLKVAARTSSFYFKGRNEPIPEIAQKLGVAYVVEGSVRKAGNKVRITAQLIKAADGFHVWSETYDRELKDIFAVQDEIAKNILGVVKGSLLGEAELPHATTTKIEAYTLFLQAQGAFAKRGEANLRESVRLFEAALAIAPDYVPALVGMAKALVVLPNYAYTSGARARESTDAAKKAARRALELDPQNAAAYAVIGWANFQCDWHWSDGLAAVRRATELAPNDSWGWNCLGDCTRMSGDFAAGLQAKQREWELDPLSVSSHWDLSYSYLVAGNNDQAIHWAGLSADLGPANMDSYMPGILAAGRSGRYDLMHQTLAKARQNVHDSEGMQLLLDAQAALMEKKPDEARRSLAAAVALMDTGHVPPAYLGYLYLLAGETAKALTWLQRGCDQHDPALVWNEIIDLDVIAANPTTRPVLDNPELKELRDLRHRNARAATTRP